MALVFLALSLSVVAVARADVSEYGIVSTAASVSTAQAGAHPDLRVRVDLKTDPATGIAFAGTREVVVDLPPGLVGGAGAFPTCPIGKFLGSLGIDPGYPCPIDSQVGVINLGLSNGGAIEGNGVVVEPLYNLPPTENAVARLGFFAANSPLIIEFVARPESGYGLAVSVRGVSDFYVMSSAEAVAWGEPSDPSHDGLRLTPFEALECGYPCEAPNGVSRPSGLGPVPFMTNPTRCVSSRVSFAVTSYALPGEVFQDSAALPPVVGCAELDFSSTASLTATTKGAESPSGMGLTIEGPSGWSAQADTLAPAALRRVAIELPKEMGINTSAADGLESCSEQEVGLLSEEPARFDNRAPDCPDASIIGHVTVETPLVSTPLQGALYLAAPWANPTHSRVGLYLLAKGPGLLLKLPGQLNVDPRSGQIEARFDELPPQQFSKVSISFGGGPRGLFTTPPACGRYRASVDLLGWGGQVARQDTEISTTTGPAGQGCPAGHFSPGFVAGTVNPVAGATSPFVLRVDRAPGEEHLAGLQVQLPKGLLANLANIDICRSAVAASGECPASSRVGNASILSGAGPFPLQIPLPPAPSAPIYLAGPYMEDPFSLVVALPAEAGPFELGQIVLRAGLGINPKTAQVELHPVSLPQFVDGFPIAYRRLRLDLSRAGFIRNPTSCERSRVDAQLTSVTGNVASLGSRFQVGGCERLPFRPKLTVSLSGPTGRSGHPRLKLLLTGKEREAGLEKLSVRLPPDELLDDRHISDVCSYVAFAQRNCPSSSVVGRVRVWTPLLDRPLQGAMYLRSSHRRLPALVASLNGQVELNLVGHIRARNGQLEAGFANLPDAPVEKLLVSFESGKGGLLVSTRDLCQAEHRTGVRLEGQNGERLGLRPLVRTICGQESR